MSYDHILLPSGAASSLDEIDAYLTAQEGLPETDAIAEIAAELNARDSALPEEDAFLSSPVSGPSGDTLFVPSPYDAIGFVRNLLFDLATPRGYAVYDPQLSWLIDPAGHIPVAVTHGGAGEFPYLTEELAHRWVAGLAAPNPYLIVERGAQDYIQTYREPNGLYTLEYRDGSAERHFGTKLGIAAEVARVIWDWTNGKAVADAANWARVEL
ncbi:hypothetical protein [Nocardia caishijiensis]|uniref:Uncharacterized protein n=1 Tax=Nocardia caishijiensis TaxID=184756 RepID=A0ABQ6YFH5_9NOCA|nr:hypothetical protein [Nocardia caishijiensis]KAF0836735.1 hypothetical protein FNL39_11250 [Nocardia caishijiensis]